MTFRIEKMQAYLKEAICKCGGSFKCTGYSQPVSPPRYGHECLNCKDTQWLDNVYPHIIHKKPDDGT